MEKQTFGSPKEIVKYPEHCIAVSVVLDRTAFEAVATANGGVVPAGTPLHFDLKNRAVKAIPTTAEKTAVGVLRYDVKLAGKEADGAAAIIEGYIDLAKVTAPSAADEAALKFVRYMR